MLNKWLRSRLQFFDLIMQYFVFLILRRTFYASKWCLTNFSQKKFTIWKFSSSTTYFNGFQLLKWLNFLFYLKKKLSFYQTFITRLSDMFRGSSQICYSVFDYKNVFFKNLCCPNQYDILSRSKSNNPLRYTSELNPVAVLTLSW